MNPALADERNIANHARSGEAGQVAHDVELKLLNFVDGQAPVFGVGDHVALIEVVRHDFAEIEKSEAKLEKILGRSVYAAEQHALIADVAITHVQQRLHGAGDERSYLARIVDVRVYGDVNVALAGFFRKAFEAGEHFVLKEVLRDGHEAFGGEANVADIRNIH